MAWISEYLVGIIGLLVLIGMGVWHIIKYFETVELRKRCTVPVTGMCIGFDRRGYGRSREYNCSYTFTLGSETISGNNRVYTGGSLHPQNGDTVELMIDPEDPRRGIYDPIAKKAEKRYLYTAVAFWLISLYTVFMILKNRM
ncbi:MAG: hypothetical protein J6F31_08200 [Oscillospiraceae bacterium]|nr:hypothetical protein [Oscillospiraceae bacterium]